MKAILQFLYSSFLLLFCPVPQWCKESQGCKLYTPQTPGIHCMRDNQALEAVTNSDWVWILEMYASWCGHCQQFAPRFKELAKELDRWSAVVRVGVFDCTESNLHQQMCGKFGVQAYPTIRFFQPQDSDPLKFKKVVVGGRDTADIRRTLVHHILSIMPRPQHWPDFNPIIDDAVLHNGEEVPWKATVFVFETEDSVTGAELILDFMKIQSLRILRVLSNNTAMVHHYSILEFPAVVIELVKDHYHLISGHSAKNPREEFGKKIAEYISTMDEAPHLIPHNSVPKKHTAKSSHTANVHHYKKPRPHYYNRVQLADIVGAISYSLRSEVTIHAMVSGPTFTALMNYINLLEQAFSHVKPAAIGESLKGIRLRLESRRPMRFIARKDFKRLIDSKLDDSVFPKQPKWKACNGSQLHLRGYPCALWMLMHTLTVLTLPIPGYAPPTLTITSDRALSILIEFIKNFFSCEVCRRHFVSMTQNHTPSSISTDGDAVLWLWQTHNLVNARLEKEGGGDPAYPKDLFPLYTKCPYCYHRTSSGDHALPMSHDHNPFADMHPNFNNTDLRYRVESVEHNRRHRGIDSNVEDKLDLRMGRSLKAASGNYVFAWNHTAVLLYLWNFYHLDYQLHTTHVSVDGQHKSHLRLHAHILHAAWPNRYGQKQNMDEVVGGRTVQEIHHYSHKPVGSGCLMSVIVVVVFLVYLAYWLFKKKRWRRLFHSSIRYRFLEVHEKV